MYYAVTRAYHSTYISKQSKYTVAYKPVMLLLLRYQEQS